MMVKNNSRIGLTKIRRTAPNSRRILKIWNASSPELKKPDTDEALKNVLARIRTTERETPVFEIKHSEKVRTPFLVLSKSNFARAAAAIIIFIGAAILITILLTRNNTITFSVANKNINSINLSDGTKVTLDAGSSLSYPEKFSGSNTRSVTLSGKAIFEVTRNESVPFVIHAKNGLITVLGTKFNVSAWPKNDDVTIAVIEGKVSLRPDDKNSNQEAILTKGKMSSLSADGKVTPPVDVDILKFTSWINREIYFQNETFGTVIDQLERWYDVKIELKDSSLFDNRITVFIENKPLKENLKVIAALMNLNFEINKNIVVLSPAK